VGIARGDQPCAMERAGQREGARESVGPLYSWFAEGFDTADLKEAKALLHELA
jgi:hypothetical protein